MSGELHDETNYGKPYKDGKKDVVHIRKGVDGLSANDIANIADDGVKKAVEAKLQELGDLAACEKNKDWPTLPKGGGVPIRKVRLKKVLKVTPIGDEAKRRYVAESSNHHVAIYAQLDAQGKEKRWEGIIVSLLEAYERKSIANRSEAYRNHHRITPIIMKNLPDAQNQPFKFSLMGGDTVKTEIDYDERGKLYAAGIYRVRTIAANGQVSLLKINDSRMKKEIKDAKEWWSPSIDTLRKLNARKVVVDLLGRVHPAND
jgi:hypothetical protein